MTLENRITSEEVVAAYRQLNATPRSFQWWDKKNRCGCALGVLAIARGIATEDQLDLHSTRRLYVADLAHRMNLSEQYLSGFVSGFDGMGETNPSYARYRGLMDGRAARAAVEA